MRLSTTFCWWNYVFLFGDKPEEPGDWSASSFTKVVGDGMRTSFGHGVWVRFGMLSVSFEMLFLVSEHKTLWVRWWEWVDDVLVLKFRWRRSLQVWEEGLLGELEGFISSVVNIYWEDD